MADVNSNYLSTPEGYATPEQIKAIREYAKALQQGGLQQPVKHWTQGVSNIVSALVGGSLDYGAAQKEKAARDYDARAVQGNIPAQNYPDTPVGPTSNRPFSEGPSSAGVKNAGMEPRGIRNNNPLNIEAGDFTKSQPGYAGSDGRFARFETPEHGMSAANALLDSYEKRGLNTVASIIGRWSPASDGNNVSAYVKAVSDKLGVDPNTPLPREMRDKLIAAMGQHENGRPINMGAAGASSFNGPSDFSKVPAVQAVTNALRGGAPAVEAGMQVAGDPTVAAAKAPVGPATQPGLPLRATPDPAGGASPYVNPALIKPQPAYTPQDLHRILASPWVPQEVKDRAYQMALQQGQPVFMRSPTGMGQVLVDPRNPGTQQFFAPDPHFTKRKIGDIENEDIITTDQRGNPVRVRPPRTDATTGPRSEVEPPAGGTGTGNGPPVVGNKGVAETAPAAPAEAATAPVKVASTDPTAGVAAGGTTAPTEPKIEVAANEGAATPLTRLQGLKAPPGVDPEDWEALKGTSNLKMQNALEEEAGKKSIESGAKRYDTLTQQGTTARKLLPQIDLARALMSDENYRGGWGKSLTDEVKRVKAALLGDKYANASNEVFDKLMAGNVLDTMKTALGGLGQVRLAEIDLLNRANGSRNNTDASNQAVLEISRRGLVKLDQISGLAHSYMSGDDVVDPVSGKVLLKANIGADGEVAPRRALDAKFDKIAAAFDRDHPSFTPAEIKNYQTLFEAPGTASKAAGKTEMSPADKQALDWANSNPKDPRAIEIKKKLGVP